MRRLLPAFVQRRWLISAARRALAAGRPASALEILRDEILAGDPRAENLRALLLPLVPAPPAAPPPAPPQAPPPAGAAQAPRSELRDLLAQMRAAHPGAAAPDPPAPAPAASAGAAPGGAPRPKRLRLSIDDAGTFLLCAGESADVGHARAGVADIPILTDLQPRHARFTLVPASFHGGAAWRVEALGTAEVRVGEPPAAASARPLAPGERVELSPHTALRFDQPERGSSSATLDLDGSLEAAGARRVLLFAPGAEGRLCIGPRSSRHVPTPLCAVELELEHDGARLRVRCATGLVPDESAGPPRTEVELPLDLARAQHLRLCMPSASERPRWISFSPLEDA